jgi:hypothetical protein
MSRSGRKIINKFSLVFLFLGIMGISVYFLIYRANREHTQRLELIEDRVQRMEQLVTARQTYREVIYTEKKLLLADKRVLFSLIFNVEAGVRLENCRVVKQPGGGVIVYLPPVEILSIDADESSIKQYFVKEQLTPVRFSDFSTVVNEEKEQILIEARASGLENRAEANAVNGITAIFRMAQIENVTVKFSEVLSLDRKGNN